MGVFSALASESRLTAWCDCVRKRSRSEPTRVSALSRSREPSLAEAIEAMAPRPGGRGGRLPLRSVSGDMDGDDGDLHGEEDSRRLSLLPRVRKRFLRASATLRTDTSSGEQGSADAEGTSLNEPERMTWMRCRKFSFGLERTRSMTACSENEGLCPPRSRLESLLEASDVGTDSGADLLLLRLSSALKLSCFLRKSGEARGEDGSEESPLLAALLIVRLKKDLPLGFSEEAPSPLK